MDKFRKYNELLCEQFCEEMKKFEEHPTPERLKSVKDLAEVWADLQCIEAGEAMRKIARREYGYDENMGMEEWDAEPIYAIYNASRGGRGGRRRRDSRGRYVSNRGDRNGGMYNAMEYPSYMPPMYNDYDGYDDEYEERGMENRGNRNMRRGNREMYNEYDPNQMYTMRQHNGRPIMTPYNAAEKGEAPKKLTKEHVDMWMNEIENEDGTTGEHWNEQQIDQLAQKVGVKFDKFSKQSFRAAVNMLYSDYCDSLSKYNANKPEVYACLAKDFLEDEDFPGNNGDEKIALYYYYIVQRD